MLTTRNWLIVSILMGITLPASADANKNPWQSVQTPAKGAPMSIGDYSAGCLQGAQVLPLDGPGYQVMHPSRNRFYGHPHLIDFIQKLGKGVHDNKLGVILIGDLSLPRGGRAKGGHASHQSGLDVDIWYWYPNKATKRLLTNKEREHTKARNILNGKTRSIRKHWAPIVAKVLQLTAMDPRVERIFVHPIIKRDLCSLTLEDRSWLRKIRPWFGHADHFHVRLACPADSPDCIPQAKVPSDDGCDEMDYWFDEAAQSDREKGRKRYQRKVIDKPKLPQKCIDLLGADPL